MHNYGSTSLSEFLGDQVIYRNLEPADPDLPGLGQLGPTLGFPEGQIPRKSDPDYARLVAQVLSIAQSQRGVKQPIRRLLFIGDTRLLDGTAFSNLCRAGDWPGMAFIGSENREPAQKEVVPVIGGELYQANRWSAVNDFERYALRSDFGVDETTAVILDIDKTLLGARGRNSQVIDQARLEAMQATIADIMGEPLDQVAFQRAYQELNQPEFHPFTGDNQDILAYVCLTLSSGLYALPELLARIRKGELATFAQLLDEIEQRRSELPQALAAVQGRVYARVRAGDPTPFKSFRRREYLNTIERFGCLPDDTPVEDLLVDEIVITQEVRAIALDWKVRGALLFGLSDKPDEAALPAPELAAQGYLPIHQAKTHSVGE